MMDTTTFEIKQYPDYSITSQGVLKVNSIGGTNTMNLRYVNRTEAINFWSGSFRDLPDWCEDATASSTGLVTIVSKPNLSNERREKAVIVSYATPHYGQPRTEHTFTLSQEPAAYDIRLSPAVLSVPAESGEKSLTVSYGSRRGSSLQGSPSFEGLPSWARLTDLGDGLLRLSYEANPVSQDRNATITISYPNPLGPPEQVSTTLSFTQRGIDYSLKATVDYLDFSHHAEPFDFSVVYSSIKRPFDLVYERCEDLPSWLTLTHLGDNAFRANAAANPGSGDRQERLTLWFTDPADASVRRSVQVTAKQTAKGTGIYFNPYNLTIPATGGMAAFAGEYIHYRTDTIVSSEPRYLSATGLPSGAKLSCTFNTSALTLPINSSGATRSGKVTVTFSDPEDASGTGTLTASFRYTQPSILIEASAGSLTRHSYTEAGGAARNSSVTYYDGLGRASQQILVAAAPGGKDLVTFAEYDCMGRADSVTYLPFTANSQSGVRLANPRAAQVSYYGNDGAYANSKIVYDRTPLGLALMSNSPGQAYNLETGYRQTLEQRPNATTDLPVRRYSVDDSNNLRYEADYAPGQLWVSHTKAGKADGTSPEDQQRDIYEYTDAQGLVVAKEVRISATDRRMTYYVYDEMGRERFILPPPLNTLLTAGTAYPPDNTNLKLYAYYTAYNTEGLPCLQRNPGADETKTLYDKRDRPVLTQDGNLRAQGQWLFVKYDILSRPILTGTTSGTEASHKTGLAGQTVFFEKTGGKVVKYRGC